MLAKNSASKVGVLFYMVPVITMLLDYLTFGNKVTWITIMGALLVIVAVKGFGKVQLTPVVLTSKA
jgi:drug/metabolite transporter (DMT)-like permease